MAIKTFLLRSLVTAPGSTDTSTWSDIDKITDDDLTTYGGLVMNSRLSQSYSDFIIKAPTGIAAIPPNSIINSIKLITYAGVHPNAHVILVAVRKYINNVFSDNGTVDYNTTWIAKNTLKVSEISGETRFGSWTRDELVGSDGTDNEKYSGICFYIRVVNESYSKINAMYPRYFQLEVNYTPPSYTLLDTSTNGKLYDINNPTYDLKVGHLYEYGTTVQIGKESDTGYKFVKYNGILEPYNTLSIEPEVTMTSDLTISADFKKINEHSSTPYTNGKKVTSIYAGNKKVSSIYRVINSEIINIIY